MPRIELEIDNIPILSPSTSKDMKAVGDDIKTLRDYVQDLPDTYVTDNLDKDIKNLFNKIQGLKQDIERVQGQDVAPIAELQRKVEGAWTSLSSLEKSIKELQGDKDDDAALKLSKLANDRLDELEEKLRKNTQADNVEATKSAKDSDLLWNELRELSAKAGNNSYLINQWKNRSFWQKLKDLFS